MENNENLVTEVTENVEETTEQTTGEVEQKADETPEKVYTEEEFNQKMDELLPKKIARREAKIRKEYERKYGELENVLRSGTGMKKVEDITESFKDFYKEKGIDIPTQPQYSERDIEVLAKNEADEIISSGMDDVVEEVDRLAAIGARNMNAREKAVFKQLAEYRKNAERGIELEKIGVTKDVYESSEFKDFASKFSSSTPVTEIFDIYNKMQPQKQIQTAGSMKTTQQTDTGVKDFYTVDEARKFTDADYKNTPGLYDAVVRSSYKWK